MQGETYVRDADCVFSAIRRVKYHILPLFSASRLKVYNHTLLVLGQAFRCGRVRDKTQLQIQDLLNYAQL
jgi:hypothetical protein